MQIGSAFIEFMPTLARSGLTRLGAEAARIGRQVGERFGQGFDSGQKRSMQDAQKNANAFTNTLAVMGTKAVVAGAGIASVTPAILHLTGALLPAAGAALALPGALLAVKVASGVVKLAVLGVGEAIDTGFTGTAKEAAEALKALPPEARIFATSVIGLKGNLDNLRGSVSDRFFEPINQSFEPLVNRYMPLANQQLPQIAQAMGATAAQFAKAATNGRLFKGVNMLLDSTSMAIAIGNENVSAMTDALGSLLQVSAGGLPRIATWFAEASGKAADFINHAKDTGQLKQWLDQGLTTLKVLGQTFVNVGSIIFSVIKAANQSGGSLLITIRDITGQVAAFLKSAQGMSTLTTVFSTLSAIGAGLRTGLAAVLPAIAQALAIIGPTFAQLAPVAGQFIAALAPLIPHFTQMANLLLQLLIPALAALARFMTEHTTTMKVVATVIGTVVLAMRAYALAQAIGKAATIAATVATTAWTVITRGAAIASNIWAVAQWALNAAMAANPVGVVIIAIIALVAAIVLAWKHSETFRSIVMAVWNAIKVAIGAVADWFVKNVWPALKTAIDAIGNVFMWLWRNVISPVWDGIKVAINVAWTVIKAIFTGIEAAVRVVAAIFTWLWKNIIDPVWQGIKLVIQINAKIIEVIFGIIEVAIRALALLFQWLWNNVIVPVWNGIRTAISVAWNWLKANVFDPVMVFIRGVFTATWNFLSSVISTVWNAIKTAISAAWNWIKGNVLDPVITFVKGALVSAWETAKSGITAAWNAIKTPVQAAWNWIKDNVFTPLSNFITKTIPDAFTKGVGFIKTAWAKVQEAASVPVKFVVNTIINEGIIKGFNWISDKVGGPHIDPIKLGFADGGVLPGYTPGRDVHRFSGPAGTLDLSGGEAILRPELTKALGSEFVHAGNRAARTGQARNFLQNFMQHGGNAQFADGGIFGGIKSVAGGIVGGISKAWDAFTNPVETFKSFINGMLGGIGGAPVIGDILRNTVGKMIDSVSTKITSMFESSSQAMGGAGGPGNWQAMWNWVKSRFPSAQLFSGLRNSTTLSGNRSLHADGRAIDVTPNRAISNAIIATFGKNITELISPWKADHVWHGQRPHDYGHALDAQHGVYGSNAHIHWGMKLGGILKRMGLYDQGGWLGAGGIAVNMSRKPEAVLTPEESVGLKAMGTDKLIDLLIELIQAVREVAPGVGSEIRGSGKRLITQARGV